MPHQLFTRATTESMPIVTMASVEWKCLLTASLIPEPSRSSLFEHMFYTCRRDQVRLP
jgi:hypothetical protein